MPKFKKSSEFAYIKIVTSMNFDDCPGEIKINLIEELLIDNVEANESSIRVLFKNLESGLTIKCY